MGLDRDDAEPPYGFLEDLPARRTRHVNASTWQSRGSMRTERTIVDHVASVLCDDGVLPSAVRHHYGGG
jgi:hypothetical protein